MPLIEDTDDAMESLLFSHVPAAIARVKSAIAPGWCKQPTGLFVQTLKNDALAERADVVVNKEYARPKLKQFNHLG